METTSTSDGVTRSAPMGRRRLLGIAGCAAGLAAGGGVLANYLWRDAGLPRTAYRWRGVVLGAAGPFTWTVDYDGLASGIYAVVGIADNGVVSRRWQQWPPAHPARPR